MKTLLRWLLVGASVSSFAIVGCERPEDWEDPAYVSDMISVGDERAFDEFTRLSEEDQAEIVPQLIELYFEGLRKEECVRALMHAGDERAKDVFLDALAADSDALAAQGARGLAAIGATETAGDIAERLTEVANPDVLPAFLEALNEIPTAASADIVAEMLMDQASRIGGIGTVREGCRLLGAIDGTTEATQQAMVHGLVNMVAATGDDAMGACELAILNHGDEAIGELGSILQAENQYVSDRLTSLSFRLVEGQKRAAAVLSHINSDASRAALLAWFEREHTLPQVELSQMALQEQQIWFGDYGMLFGFAVGGLAYDGSDEALAILRSLESVESEGSRLANFEPIFGLSDVAEFGLRTAVHERLAQVGTDEDRELLWNCAAEGTLEVRGNVGLVREMRSNCLHFVARASAASDMERFDALLEGHNESTQQAMATHRAYFIVPAVCNNDVSCYAGLLEDPSPVLNNEALQTLINEQEEEVAQTYVRDAITGNITTAAVWQLARIGDQAAASALAENIDNGSLQVRNNVVEALTILDTTPSNLEEEINTFLEADANNTQAGAKEYRHALRVLLHMKSN